MVRGPDDEISFEYISRSYARILLILVQIHKDISKDDREQLGRRRDKNTSLKSIIHKESGIKFTLFDTPRIIGNLQ